MVADPFLSETAAIADVVLPAAQWAEEEGTMTNLEGRILLRRRMVAPLDGRADGCGDRQGAGGPAGAGASGSARSRGRSSTSCAGPARAGWRTIAASLGSGSRRRTACSGPARARAIRARRARSSTGSRRASGRARFHRVEHRATAEEPDAEFPDDPDHRPGHGAVPVRHADAAGAGAATRPNRRHSARSMPTWRARSGSRRATRVRLTSRRGTARDAGPADRARSGSIRCSCRSTGAARPAPTC